MNLGWIGAALVIIALALGWSGIRLMAGRRWLSGTGTATLALGAVAAGGLCLGLATSFAAIDRLAEETELGTVTLSRLQPGVYLATLDLDGEGQKRYRLAGDHWQLDVRFLRWRLPARLLGADSLFQLDRISGRYAEPAKMAHAELTAYALSDAPGRLMWNLAAEAGKRVPWIDAEYGSAVYLPMADGARFRVAVTDSGLLARPDNAAARQASASW